VQHTLLTVGLLAAVCAATAAEPINIKPGLWETTTTGTTTLTGKPLGPDAATLDAMPPEERARVEEFIKKQASGAPVVQTNQSCVTQEQLSKGLASFAGDPAPQCKTEVLEQSPTDYHFRQVCIEGGAAISHVDVKIHLDSPESATTTVDGTNTSGGRTMTMTSKAASKWIGSDCGQRRKK
jgi:uncharacterized protein DUF3617